MKHNKEKYGEFALKATGGALVAGGSALGVGIGLNRTGLGPMAKSGIGGVGLILGGLGVGVFFPTIGAGMMAGGATVGLAFGTIAMRNRMLQASTKALPAPATNASATAGTGTTPAANLPAPSQRMGVNGQRQAVPTIGRR